jgi:hypothetical protein
MIQYLVPSGGGKFFDLGVQSLKFNVLLVNYTLSFHHQYTPSVYKYKMF